MNAIKTSDIIVAHLNICNVINIYILKQYEINWLITAS